MGDSQSDSWRLEEEKNPLQVAFPWSLDCRSLSVITILTGLHRLTGNISVLRIIFIPWSKVLPEKLTGPQLVRKFPAFYGNRRFMTAYTRARHLSLTWSRSIQPIPPHHTPLRSILILSCHPRLCLPSCLLPPGVSILWIFKMWKVVNPADKHQPFCPHDAWT
jgi:hypothetical protein